MFKMQVGKAGGEKWKSLSATVRSPGSGSYRPNAFNFCFKISVYEVLTWKLDYILSG